MLGSDKHSSLFCRSFSDEGKKKVLWDFHQVGGGGDVATNVSEGLAWIQICQKITFEKTTKKTPKIYDIL